MFGKLWFAAVLLMFGLAPTGWAGAAELVMFESDVCEWCEKWNNEIGGIYDKTEEAQLAPLRRVDIHGPVPDDLSHIPAVHYTPTFVLMQDGEEVGRILGYPGEDFFWGLLAEELAKLHPESVGSPSNIESGTCADKPGRTIDETIAGSAAVC